MWERVTAILVAAALTFGILAAGIWIYIGMTSVYGFDLGWF
jgi:hypothetical protein